MALNYKILGSHWMNENMGQSFGTVAVEVNDGKWKVYIGFILGFDDQLDEQHVAAFGQQIYSKPVATAFFPDLNPDKFEDR